MAEPASPQHEEAAAKIPPAKRPPAAPVVAAPAPASPATLPSLLGNRGFQAAVGAAPPPSHGLVLWAQVVGQAQRQRAGSGARPVPMTAQLFDAINHPIGDQLPGGRIRLKDGSAVTTTSTSGTALRVSVDWGPVHTVRKPGLLDWASELNISEYQEHPPQSGSSEGPLPFTAVYEFFGDARRALVHQIEAGIEHRKHVSNTLAKNHTVNEGSFLGHKAVELVVRGGEVSANTEGSVDVPTDWSHNDMTARMKKRLTSPTTYSTLNVPLFEALLREMKTLSANKDKDNRYSGMLEEGTFGGDALRSGREFGDWFTATVSRSSDKIREKGHPKLADFISSRRGGDTHGEVLRVNMPDEKGVVTMQKVNIFRNEPAKAGSGIPLDLFDNLITGFSSVRLASRFPVGALGVLWISGKEQYVQAFFVADAKGGSDGLFEAPGPLLAKVDGTGSRDPRMYASAYRLGNHELHVIVFPGTRNRDRFFLDKGQAGDEHSIIAEAVAKDPFDLVHRYLLSKRGIPPLRLQGEP